MKIDECGKNFDEIAKCWKLNSEKSCRRELILATIKEVVEAAEKELVPAGFKTVNVGELGLSFPSVNTPHTADEVRALNTEKLLESDNLKLRVKDKLKEGFDEHVFLEVLKLFSSSQELNSDNI